MQAVNLLCQNPCVTQLVMRDLFHYSRLGMKVLSSSEGVLSSPVTCGVYTQSAKGMTGGADREGVKDMEEEREGKHSRVLTSEGLYWKEGGFEMERKNWKAVTVNRRHSDFSSCQMFFFFLYFL